MKSAIIYILIIVIGSLLLLSQRPRSKPVKASSTPIEQQITRIDPNYVMNPIEAQERLRDQGFYKGKIDGKWGKQTDEAYCNWCAVQTFKPEYYEVGK